MNVNMHSCVCMHGSNSLKQLVMRAVTAATLLLILCDIMLGTSVSEPHPCSRIALTA